MPVETPSLWQRGQQRIQSFRILLGYRTPITAAKLVLSAGWGNTPNAAWTALTGATQSVQGTITNGTAGLAANPTITYTFPTPYPLLAPTFCSAYQLEARKRF